MYDPATHAATSLPRPRARAGCLCAAALAAWVGLGSPEPAVAEQRKPTPAQKEAELEKVQSRIDKVRKSVNADIEKRDRLGVELRDAELGMQAARRRLEELRAQRIASEARLEDLERDLARREQELDAERDALSGELRAAYVNGREEHLKLLLNQEDPGSLGRMLAYYGYFGRARADRIGDIRGRLAELAGVREQIAAETGRLAGLEAEQEREVAGLRSAQERRARAVVSIESQIKSRGGELTLLLNDIASACKAIGHEVNRGALAGNLATLYDYMVKRLVHANAKNDVGALDEVAHLLTELKEAWDSIRPQVVHPPVSESSRQAGYARV